MHNGGILGYAADETEARAIAIRLAGQSIGTPPRETVI